MFVGSKLPHAHTIEHDGRVIVINGANVGYDPANPWRSGAAPDSPDRIEGTGLTLLEGKDADAFKAWFELTKKGDGPAKSGAIFFADSKADTAKESKIRAKDKTGTEALDPGADLPRGLETASGE